MTGVGVGIGGVVGGMWGEFVWAVEGVDTLGMSVAEVRHLVVVETGSEWLVLVEAGSLQYTL